VPVGTNQIAIRKTIREAAEATKRGKLRPNWSTRRPARTPATTRAGHADHPLRSVGARRHRSAADPQGRRLREHQRALAAGRARTSGALIDRSTASGASCTRSGTRRARAAARARSACASAAIAPGYAHAKQQLFRTLDDTNPDARLAALESQVMATINSLGVGPMGFAAAPR
jgi:fumarate hydratase class I